MTGSDVAGCVVGRGTLHGTRAVRGEAGGSRASIGSPRSGCRNAVNRRARLAGGTDPEPVEDTHAPVSIDSYGNLDEIYNRNWRACTYSV